MNILSALRNGINAHDIVLNEQVGFEGVIRSEFNEEQTTQWPKEKAQKDNQLSTKHTHKTKDLVTRTHTNHRG